MADREALSRESQRVGSEWRRVKARSNAKPNARLRITHVEKLASGEMWVSYERLDEVSAFIRTGSMALTPPHRELGARRWVSSEARALPLSTARAPVAPVLSMGSDSAMDAGFTVTITLLLDGDMLASAAESAAQRIFEQAFNDDAVVAGDYDVQPETVKEIRRLGEEPGARAVEVAARFGLDRRAVGRYWSGETWPELGGRVEPALKVCPNCGVEFNHGYRHKVYCSSRCQIQAKTYRQTQRRREAA